MHDLRMWATATLLTSAACTAELEPDLGDEPVSRLYGDVEYGDDCDPDMIALLEDSMELGRIASNTDTFRECVADRMTSLYTPCAGDPHSAEALDDQIDRALDATRMTNDVKMWCTGGSGNASTWPGDYGHDNHEEFWWSEWLEGVVPGPTYDVCGPGEFPTWGPGTCRPIGWPWSQIAGTAWHEVSHTHGYRHDSCGISDPGWHFQVNTVPYIVGNCLAKVMNDSADQCGENVACGDVSYMMLEDGACECRRDPVPPWTEDSFAGHDRWYTGDFNDDGKDDIFRTINQWGGAEVQLSNGEFFESDGLWTGAGFYGHRWYVGNFDGQGGDDVLRLSHQYGGAEVFTSDGNSFSSQGVWTGAGIWGHRWYVGDFDGDGIDDLMRLSHQHGGAEVFLSDGSGSFNSAGVWSGAGIWGDEWYVGDFDDDGRDDIMRLTHQYGGAEVLLSNGSDSFDSDGAWTGAGYWGHRWYVGNFDGQGGDDIMRLNHQWGGADVLLSTGSGFSLQSEWTGAGIWGNRWYPGDYDGDGIDDILRLHDAAGGAEVFKSDGVTGFER